LENAREGSDGGSTDFVITNILKTDPALGGRKVVRIPRYLPIADLKNPPQLLAFGVVAEGKPDLYRGIPGKQALDYIKGSLAIDAKDRIKLMRYCFDYLEHENSTLAGDAFGEFINSTDPDIRTAAGTLSADKLRHWLQDERTPPERLRLYAFLLANCGSQEDATLLRQLLDKLVKRAAPPLIDGVLTAYTLLRPREGWAYTCELLKDPATSFSVRYAGLRAARYFHTTQPEVVSEKDILDAVSHSLEQSDLANIAIEYLRQWQWWQPTAQVLALFAKKSFDVPTVRRSIVRYALQCPDPRAARFVAELRKANPSLVEEVEAGLKAESKSTTAMP
jgi:hypothetical protein